MRALGVLLATALVISGCATAAQRQVQQSIAVTQQASKALKTCLTTQREQPEYASLVSHLPDLDSGQPTIAQLTDDTIPSPEDARLTAALYDRETQCRAAFLNSLAAARPDLVPILADATQRGSAVVVLVVKRKITWADAARKMQAEASITRKQVLAANQAWLGEMNAENRAEIAQRQAAANALMQWSIQQQMINAANRPVFTNCNTFGSSVNCISH